MCTCVHIRVTLGHLWVTIGFFSISKHKADTTELHPKVRQTCYLFNLKFKHYRKIPRISLATAVDGMNISIHCYDITAAGPMHAGTAG